jgi:thioredoxin 1
VADIPDMTLDSFEPEVLMASTPTLVYYYAAWCKPCQEMGDDLSAVADEVAERLKVVQVNTDTQGDIVKRQQIRTIPSFQLIHSGKSVTVIQGKQSRLELMGKLSAFVADSPTEADEGPEETSDSPAEADDSPAESPEGG